MIILEILKFVGQAIAGIVILLMIAAFIGYIREVAKHDDIRSDRWR